LQDCGKVTRRVQRTGNNRMLLPMDTGCMEKSAGFWPALGVVLTGVPRRRGNMHLCKEGMHI